MTAIVTQPPLLTHDMTCSLSGVLSSWVHLGLRPPGQPEGLFLDAWRAVWCGLPGQLGRPLCWPGRGGSGDAVR